MEQTLPYGCGASPALPTPQLQTSSLQDYKGYISVVLSPLSLWCLVTAALGN